jgi:ATP-dependent helicase/DNAse subunit B
MRVVSLKLVTGPANAEKAGVVLSAYRSAIGRDPILVVPTAADVDHYRRELISGGTVFGANVVAFGGLLREIARRTGFHGARIGDVARERVMMAAAEGVELDALAASAATPGFARAAIRLASELEAARVTPQRLTSALRTWAGEDGRRRRYGDEVAALYAGYRRGLDRAGWLDPELYACGALDALRREPHGWGETPVFFYGFDDLDALQRDAVGALASVPGVDVTVSLPYEAGRAAFSGRATTFLELTEDAKARRDPAEVVSLPAVADHYDHPALHYLERTLFDADAVAAPAGGAVALLRGGGERAELELVGAGVRRLLDGGMAPEEIAVVARSLPAVAALVEETFEAFGIPYALERRVPVGRTALGRALLGLARAALPGGTAADLLAWLRAPGVLDVPALADELEARLRRAGVTSADGARELWERERWPLDAVSRLRNAATAGGNAFLVALEAELPRIFAAPYERQAPVLTDPEQAEARAFTALRETLRELLDLARAEPALTPQPAAALAALAAVEILVGDPPGPGRVTVSDPLAIRARRVRALFLCRLQEGEFPPPPRPEPFFGDAERRAIAEASGLRLRDHEDDLGAERYLLYAAVSRPTERLVLSWHDARDDGAAAVRSLFVDDVADVLDGLEEEQRELGAVGWAPGAAPTAHEARRGAVAAGPRLRPPALGPLRDAGALDELRERQTWSPSSLELWVGCPVRWFVERWLAPETLEPDPEPMTRGSLAHRVLEAVFTGLDEPLGEATLPRARELLREALEEHAAARPLSVNAQRLRSHTRRLEVDLLRYLDQAAASESRLRPTHFELAFGLPDAPHPAAELAGGELRLGGRVDRVDVDPAGDIAVVVDYKGRRVSDGSKWLQDRRLQGALYLLALREILGLDVAGSLYQPLGGRDPRPRGVLREGVDPGSLAPPSDHWEEERLEAVLADVVQVAVAAVREAREGRLEPRPGTCGYGDSGCQYPAICRCEP